MSWKNGEKFSEVGMASAGTEVLKKLNVPFEGVGPLSMLADSTKSCWFIIEFSKSFNKTNRVGIEIEAD